MEVSRRDFLKGSLAGVAALALTSVGLGGTQAEAAGLNSKDPAEKPGFFTNPYNHAASDAAKVVTTEVVVVGAGNAGCAAAASLADNNVKPWLSSSRMSSTARAAALAWSTPNSSRAWWTRASLSI